MFPKGRQTRKHCFLAMFPKGGQTRKHCFLAMFPKGGQTRKHCFLAMFLKGGQTKKRCFLAMFPKGGQTRKQCFQAMYQETLFPTNAETQTIQCFLGWKTMENLSKQKQSLTLQRLSKGVLLPSRLSRRLHVASLVHRL